MTEINIKNFEDGLVFVINTILEGKDKPVLVSIMGYPNSGKSELRKRAHYKLRDTFGKFGWIGMGGDSLDRFAQTKGCPDYFIMEDMPYADIVDKHTRSTFNRLPDLKVFMSKEFSLASLTVNLRNDIGEGKYGLVIDNPLATEKKLYKL